MIGLQQRFMFFPEVLAPGEHLAFRAPHEERTFSSRTGNTLHAVVVRAASVGAARRGTILYWHGNAGSVRTWGEVAVELAPLGFDVVVVDYAGYGKSIGVIASERVLLDDAQAVFDVVAAEERARSDAGALVLFGRSLGTGVATYLASANGGVDRLLLETPYASIVDVARRWMPAMAFVPATLVPFRLPNDVWLRDVRCPVHVFHGDEDEVIPLASAQLLQAVLPPDSTFTVVPGGRHNDLAVHGAYVEALTRALAPR